MTRAVLVALVLLVAGLVAASPRAAPERALALCTVSLADEVLRIEADGVLEPQFEQLVVTPRELGRTQIDELVEAGRRVTKGDVVARLSTFRLDDDERNARNSLRNKEAEWRRAVREGAVEKADDLQKISGKSADLDYNRQVLAYLESGPDPRIVQALGLRIDKAKLDEAYLARRVETQQSLAKRGFLAELEFEAIRTNQLKAALDREKQENSLALQREGPRVEERDRARALVSKFDLDRALASGVAESQELIRGLTSSKKEAEIADRQAAVDEVLRKRATAELKAPMDGIVVHAAGLWGEPLQAGSVAYPGREILKIVQNGVMRAKVQVNERFVERIRDGQQADLTLPGDGRTYPARVLAIGRLATQRDPQDRQSPRDFAVTLVLEREVPHLRPGGTCRARVVVARHPGVARVPIDAVRRRENGKVEVAALRSGTLEKVRCELVDSTSDFVYVRGLCKSGPERLAVLE